MVENLENSNNFEVSLAEKEILEFLDKAAIEFEIGERENLENAWDFLEQEQAIADSKSGVEDEVLCKLAKLTEKIVLECQSRGYFE